MADEKTPEELEEEEKAKAAETEAAEKEKADEKEAEPEPSEKKEEEPEVVEEEEPEAAPADNVEELKAAHASLQKEIKRLDSIIKQQVDAKLSQLGEADKDLVLDLAGKKPDAQLAMIAKLEKSGKIVCNATAHGETAVTPPAADRTRVAGGEKPVAKPATLRDASKGFARDMNAMQTGKKAS